MCGIAGILSSSPFDRSNLFGELSKQQIVADLEARLNAMQSAIKHRGPDGQGSYFCPSQQAALSHTRLAIIDLSDSGHQPMSNGNLTISFNGEIYNHQELRSQLEQSGESFNSHSDTEVILKLYAKYGSECVQKLRGMFAFIIWDSQNKTAFAARDPLGIKPFYYWHNQQHFVFSSELRGVLAAGLNTHKISEAGLSSYLQNGAVSEPESLVDDINMLAAGSYLEWQNGAIQTTQYWQLGFSNSSALGSQTNYQDSINNTRNALLDSVRAHFISDVPVGIFLSGGIDSSALLALAKQVTNQTINTYSIAFENPDWNEGDIAKRVAELFGSNHTEFMMTPEIAKPLFEEFLAAIDQPTIDGFNTYCVSKLASERGEKVVLSGLGGDELFAGYPSFEKLPKAQSFSRLLFFFSPLLNRLHTLLPTRLRRITDMLNAPNSLTVAHRAFRAVFSFGEAKDLIQTLKLSDYSEAKSNSKADSKLTLKLKQAKQNKADHANILDQISALELENYMRNQLLRDSDIMSMTWGLELRVPFVDSTLINSISNIPAEQRCQYGKKLLIDAVPELPDWVVNRPKQGFRFPFDEWFAESWQKMPSPESPKWIKLTPWYRRWSLTVLDHWATSNNLK